ncbi:MAG: tetratricopeptide repeat protein, partial [Acidobacteria bacterium]|nr:tetratricopeptide repeat protein [Acidobacteriota bacterium]
MKNRILVLIAVFILFGFQGISAQNPGVPPRPMPPAPTRGLSEMLSKNLEQYDPSAQVSRERREQAYAKLLEAQRYIWNLGNRPRPQAEILTQANFARQALQKALELNPTLAEGYTALSELTLSVPPNDLEEAIKLSNIAVKLDADNFGGHRLLARLYTIKSGLNDGNLNPVFTQKAISEWKEIVRLDARNAEAFAFLSELYAKTNKTDERIDALKRWLAAVTPLPQDTRFYRTILGTQEDLSPDTATIKLGEALMESGKTTEAVEILSSAVADNPDNPQALELLRQAIESADNNSIGKAVQALQQAVFANPENLSLIVLLAEVQARTGKIDEAAKILRGASAKLVEKDKLSAADLQLALGEIYVSADRYDEAIAIYQNALAICGIDKNELAADDERDFAMRVYQKMIDAYKKANRPADAKASIERARLLFGNNDSFADQQLILLYRETGKKPEALQAVRALRARNADDGALLRTEASILTDSGKVDEAVTLVKTLINKKTPTKGAAAGTNSESGIISLPNSTYDNFDNYLFISSLYSQAKRGKEAIEAANQAFQSAPQGDQRRQLAAKVTLATAQQMAGDYKSAEETLRGVLKKSPENPVALNNLGYFLAERNEKLNEALDLIQQAVKIAPTNSYYLDSLGWVYFKLGKLDEAEKYLKDALRFDASSATINEHLGDVYQKQGKLDLAKSAWQKALNLTSDAEEINRLKAKL